MMRRGAGGTEGGLGAFLVGFLMMCGGGYLLLQGVILRPQFGFGTAIFSIGRLPITSGMVFVPFMFGVGLIFYNARSWLGWLLAIGSVTALIFGVIANTHVHLTRMTAFEMLTILVLLVGGLGLFLRSLRPGGRTA